jgi:hypothetical protein
MAHLQPNILIASPPKRAPALHPSSFAPVVNTPFPSTEDTAEVDPDFFEGTADDGSGPGPHFITMLIVKVVCKIKEQLLSALTQTVMILTDNLPNCLIHAITKPNRAPPPTQHHLQSFSHFWYADAQLHVHTQSLVVNSRRPQQTKTSGPKGREEWMPRVLWKPRIQQSQLYHCHYVDNCGLQHEGSNDIDPDGAQRGKIAALLETSTKEE